MEKTITENGIEYRLTGDYYLPNLTVPEAPHVGHWGQLRRKVLREHHEGTYTGLLLSDKLWAHLTEINAPAEQMMETIMKQMKSAEGITEELKAKDQMEWVRRMENIHAKARETVLNDLICT